MGYVQIGPAGELGVIKDLSSRDMKANAWTDGRNIRFRDNMAFQFLGHGEIYPGCPVIPYHVLPVNLNGARYWIEAGLNKVYVVSGATGSIVYTNITRTDLYGVDVDYDAEPNSWTSTTLGGIPILNPGNTVDPPQRWAPGLTNKLVNLDNWPANTFCRSMRAFKNHLVALNVTENGNRYPHMVRWSHPADPGTLPVSWAVDDPAFDGGSFNLGDAEDEIIDGLQLRDSLIVYKASSIYRLDYVGPPYIFQATKVLGTSGAMNRNCIVELDGVHLVLTNQDVLIHDGQTGRSILDKKARRDLFANIDTAGMYRCFVVKNPFWNEAWVCYPSPGATACDKALVYNYAEGTVTYRDIPNLNHANFGQVEEGASQPWGADSSTWASDSTIWNVPEYTPDAARVLAGSADRKLYLMDSSTTFDGVLPAAYLERRGLQFGGPTQRNSIRSVIPNIRGTAGATVNIQVGFAQNAYDDPTYSAAVPFTIGTTKRVDMFVEGPYVALKFSTGTADEWRLDSLAVDVRLSGEW